MLSYGLPFRVAMQAKKKKKASHLLDFDLADLVQIESNFIKSHGDKRDRRIRSFVLALSLIFNDFKDLEWWMLQLEKGEAGNKRVINEYNGQWHGMHIHVIRLMLGLFHEFLTLLKTHEDVLTDERFEVFTRNLTGEPKRNWEDVVKLALRRKTPTRKKKSFNSFMHQIRSKVAFHYDSSALYKAYLSFFSKQKLPHARFAYASLGDSMEQTRFYFADAAAQEQVDTQFKKNKVPIRDINKYRRMLNEPIKKIIETFIEIETEEAV